MTKEGIAEFIERMEEVGDVWKKTDVERVYGEMSLPEATESRMGEIHIFSNIIETMINR